MKKATLSNAIKRVKQGLIVGIFVFFVNSLNIPHHRVSARRVASATYSKWYIVYLPSA